MEESYYKLIHQRYDFPQEGFDLEDGHLTFYGVSIHKLIEKYGTPFKLVYLPRISDQVSKARVLFQQAIKKNSYQGEYNYCYCIKCCQFSFVLETALKEKVNLETSSAFDIDLVFNLLEKSLLTKDIYLIHNGYKTETYLKQIVKLNKEGFKNSIIILDSISELSRIRRHTQSYSGVLNVGLRIAVDEEEQSTHNTSRMGIRPSEIIEYYKSHIHSDDKLRLNMVHFYIDSGMKDTSYYWREFDKALNIYVELKRLCPEISALNLGGGFPIKSNLEFDHNYGYIVEETVAKIKKTCVAAGVEEPNIFTEFGKFTVGESGAIIFKVLEKKVQNEKEAWYIIDNSLLNTIPDVWSLKEKFILLPINKWQNSYTKVNIGGISCDRSDYYNAEGSDKKLLLPEIDSDEEPLYLGFFHTGAYQDAISGYGGIKHCLIPAPKMIVIDKDDQGHLTEEVIREEQSAEEMMRILGYL